MFTAHNIANAHVAARDAVALTRGMLDAAGLYGEAGDSSLMDRIQRATLGYLQKA